MFADVIGNSYRLRKRTLGINDSTNLNRCGVKEDLFVPQNGHAQSDGKKEERDESNQNASTFQNLREFAECRASKERYCRQNKDEVMRSKIKSRANHQRREEEKRNKKQYAGTCALIPKTRKCPDPGQYPDWPTSQNDFVSAAEKNLWRLTDRYEAAILRGVIDCPKPTFIENALIPEDQGCNSKWNSCPRHEDRNS